MRASSARRACTLAVVVALLSTSVGGLRVPSGCEACAPECPMHARRLRCHRTTGPHCHSSGSADTVRPACSQAAHAVLADGLRATLAPRVQAVPVFATHRLAVAGPTPVSAPLLEPPTDPPRASLA